MPAPVRPSVIGIGRGPGLSGGRVGVGRLQHRGKRGGVGYWRAGLAGTSCAQASRAFVQALQSYLWWVLCRDCGLGGRGGPGGDTRRSWGSGCGKRGAVSAPAVPHWGTGERLENGQVCSSFPLCLVDSVTQILWQRSRPSGSSLVLTGQGFDFDAF